MPTIGNVGSAGCSLRVAERADHGAADRAAIRLALFANCCDRLLTLDAFGGEGDFRNDFDLAMKTQDVD